MPEVKAAGGSPLQNALLLADNVIGELKSVGHAREPHEIIPCSVALLKYLREAGVSTVDEAISHLEAMQSLVARATGAK